MENRWKRGRNPFRLPMSVTFGTHQREDGKWIAHSLEFDLVASGTSKREALDKLRQSVKIYVEYGMSNRLNDFIIFPAPDRFWENLNGPVELLEPILVSSERMEVYARPVSATAIAA